MKKIYSLFLAGALSVMPVGNSFGEMNKKNKKEESTKEYFRNLEPGLYKSEIATSKSAFVLVGKEKAPSNKDTTSYIREESEEKLDSYAREKLGIEKRVTSFPYIHFNNVSTENDKLKYVIVFKELGKNGKHNDKFSDNVNSRIPRKYLE